MVLTRIAYKNFSAHFLFWLEGVSFSRIALSFSRIANSKKKSLMELKLLGFENLQTIKVPGESIKFIVRGEGTFPRQCYRDTILE
ncbi:MAG: hypothetical protein CMO69_00795 [Verrucomicrobiales bacterium]|nr:hypothetical protein [Verrucomicrobiales bacterium]